MKQLKVLHLRSSGAHLGAENVIIELSRNSMLLGFQSIVGAVKNRRDPSPIFLDVASNIGLNTVLFELRGIIDLNCAATIRSYIQENQIDIIHCHGYKENFYGVLSRNQGP